MPNGLQARKQVILERYQLSQQRYFSKLDEQGVCLKEQISSQQKCLICRLDSEDRNLCLPAFASQDNLH